MRKVFTILISWMGKQRKMLKHEKESQEARPGWSLALKTELKHSESALSIFPLRLSAVMLVILTIPCTGTISFMMPKTTNFVYLFTGYSHLFFSRKTKFYIENVINYI